MTKEVGEISQEVIDLLGLKVIVARTKIYLGESNIDHMKSKHPEDYHKYGDRLENILATPDYVALHPHDGSIQYIKELDNRVMVAVRLSKSGSLFVRTLFEMSSAKWDSYNRKGYIKIVAAAPIAAETASPGDQTET